MSDVWEHQYGRWRYTNGVQMRVADAQDDHDADGLTNYGEFLVGTSPIAEDSNADGLLDGDEDFDGDGLSNALEILLGTNPRVYNDMGPPSLSVATTSLPAAQIGSSYQAGLAAQHGSGTYAWTGSGLPPQLSLSSDGTLSGFVDSTLPAGIYSISVTVTDDLGASASATLSLQVVVPMLLLQPAEISLYEGEPFTLGLTATGGIGHSYQIALRGALPSNFWFQSGVLGGTATSSSHVIGFTLTDGQTTAERDLMVHVERFEFITAADLPGGCIGQPYSQVITTRGNPAVSTAYTLLPREYLPKGLTLSSGGVLSGTPLEYGVFSFTVQAIKAPAFIPILRTFTLDIKDVGDPDIPGGGTGGGTGGNDDHAPMPDVRLQTQKFEMWNNWALEAPPSPPPENTSPEILKITWPDGVIKSWEGNQPEVYTPLYPPPGNPSTYFGFDRLHWSSVWQTAPSTPVALTAWNNWVPDLGPLPHELTYEAIRVRLEADSPVPRDYTHYFILHKRDVATNNNNSVGTTIATTMVSITIKKGRKRSEMITMLPRLCEIPPTEQGPDYVHMERASIDSLLPIEIVVPEIDSEGFETGNMVAAAELKVGKMEHSLDGSHNITIDDDPDRFYIRLPNATGLQGVSVKIATVENPDGSNYNDNETTITLHEQNGRLESQSQLLVADDVDDDHPATDVGADDVAEDRTHRVQLGGKVKIPSFSVNGTTHQMDFKLPVPIEKTVHINAVRMADSGVTEQDVIDDVKIANERFAQVGLKIELDSNVLQPVPTDQMTDTIIYARTFGGALHPAAKTLMERYATMSTNEDIYLIYVKEIRDPFLGNPFGFAVIESAYPSTPGYSNNCFISSDKKVFTSAHEIGHLLTDRGHAGLDYSVGVYPHHRYHNLMYPTSLQNSIDATKRLYQKQQEWIWQHRAAQ